MTSWKKNWAYFYKWFFKSGLSEKKQDFHWFLKTGLDSKSEKNKWQISHWKLKFTHYFKEIFMSSFHWISIHFFLTDVTHYWCLACPTSIPRHCHSPTHYVVMSSRISWQTLLTHNSVTVFIVLCKNISFTKRLERILEAHLAFCLSISIHTVKSRAVDRSTIQFWNFLTKGHST